MAKARLSGTLILNVGPNAVVCIRDRSLNIDAGDFDTPHVTIVLDKSHAAVLRLYADLLDADLGAKVSI